MEELLTTRNLSKTYSGVRVLQNVDFDLRAGEVHALVGENGAGKTTLIKILTGVVRPDAGGEISVGGVPVPNMTPLKSRQMGISAIYQDISLFSNLSVAENICAGLKRKGLHNARSVRDTARGTLAQMGLDMDLDARMGDVSLGQQQLVAIARAITFNAKILIMDEPTAALSSGEVEMLYDIVKRLKAKGLGIIYISHKFDEIFAIADRVTVLRDGHLIETGPVSAYNRQKLINLIAGKELLYTPYARGQSGGERLFEVEGLTCEPHFRDISFHVDRGEVLGITGLVGAGRSEVAQCVFGLLKPDAGTVRLNGRVLGIRNARDAIREGVCYLPEDRHTQGLFMPMSVRENVNVSNYRKVLGRFRLISPRAENAAALAYISSLSVKPALPDAPVHRLSGGNQQKVLVGRWLNAEPRVFIADEVTSGVDVAVKAEIHRLLRSLADDGIAVVLISSDLDEVLAVSDRIVVMRRGALGGELEAKDATQERILELSML